MSKFSAEVKMADGKSAKVILEAVNEAEARVKLRAKGMAVLKIVNSDGAAPSGAAKKTGGFDLGLGGRVKPKELQIFTRQLATLLSSGIPILQSLDVLGKSARTPALSNALQGVINSVSQGKRLGDSLGDYPKVFDRFYVNMVRAGEESGGLDVVLNRLAIYIEKSVKVQGKVKGALIYPAVILFVAGLVIAAILIFVIPKFKQLFEGAGQELPGMTKFVISLSKFFTTYWWMVLAGGVITFFATRTYYETEPGRETLDAVMIDVPLLGSLIQKGGIARFTRTLATLLSSGVGIMEAMDIASKVVGNAVLEKTLIRARDSISEGKSITTPLVKEKYIPGMVTQMIGVGEQTGNLDTMLAKIADFYEDEVDVAVGALTSILEPLLMVFLGGIIAVLVVAMYLPIFNLAGAVG